MKKGIYSVRDKKNDFSELIFERDDYSAQRNFEAFLLNNPASIVRTHPFDFIFCRVGWFDTETGVLSSDIEELSSVPMILDKLGVEY